MRPGRTQTGMSSYWSPYIFFMRLHETGLKMNSDRPDFVSVADPTRVTFVYRSETVLFSCKTETNIRPDP